MATEELLKLIQENPMGYEGYLAYAKYLETINLKQAYLTYENALYFCDDETMKKTIQSKLDEIAYRNGKVEPASIVILCYNNRPLTQQCIESIRETTPEFAREIVIVDNNSQDDSVDYLRQQKDIVLIENDYNAGFPGGCNIGIEAAKPENDIFLLNNDTIMCFNTLYTLRMGLYEKDNYGSAGCVTNNCANNQSVFKSESLDDLKEFGRNNNIPNKRSEIKLMLIGFALIVKRKVLEKVGYLDERFNPGNFEDDDLSLRILMNNYQNVLVYNSFLIHLGSVSFNNADYFNLLHKNFDKLIDKYNFINEKHFFCFTHSECNLPFYKDKIDNLYNNANVLVSQCDLGPAILQAAFSYPQYNFYGLNNTVSCSSITSHLAGIHVSFFHSIESNPYRDIKFDFIAVDCTQIGKNDLFSYLKTLKSMLADNGKMMVLADNKSYYENWYPIINGENIIEDKNSTYCKDAEDIFSQLDLKIEFWSFFYGNIPSEIKPKIDAISEIVDSDRDIRISQIGYVLHK